MRTALLVVDMLHGYDFEDADRVAEHASDVVPVIAGLVRRAERGSALIVYVNDNYGAWNSSREELVDGAVREGRHPELVEPIRPRHEWAFVWKGRHSAFYESGLDFLLRSEGIERVVLAGQVTEQCILYSALDAYIRGYGVCVPGDACVPIHPHLAGAALEMVRENMRGETPPAAEVEL